MRAQGWKAFGRACCGASEPNPNGRLTATGSGLLKQQARPISIAGYHVNTFKPIHLLALAVGAALAALLSPKPALEENPPGPDPAPDPAPKRKATQRVEIVRVIERRSKKRRKRAAKPVVVPAPDPAPIPAPDPAPVPQLTEGE